MLEHHGQAGTQQLQLFLVEHLKLPVLVAHHADIFIVQANGSFTRLFQEVNAAQKGAFTGPGRTDDANHIPCVSRQRYAFQHFVLAIALMQFGDG
ncbi:hypothetical protein D3C79_983670 [compost metagenome]